MHPLVWGGHLHWFLAGNVFFLFSRCQQVAGNFQKFYNRKRNKPLKWEEQPLSLNDFNFSSLEELKET